MNDDDDNRQKDDSLVVDSMSQTVQAMRNPFRFRERLITRLFKAADRNEDGYISPEEAYALVLRMYVQLNRQAAIPPPSAATIRKFFQQSDKNQDGRVSRSEFDQLASILLSRATTRLVAHKFVTLLGAPILAAKVFSSLEGKKWLQRAAQSFVPAPLLPTVTNPTFVRTFLLVGFVASLGNIVLAVVNFFLNRDLGE